MSRSDNYNQTHGIDLNLPCNHFSCAPDEEREQLQSPKSVKVELNYRPLHKSYSPAGTVYGMRPTSATSSTFTQNSTTKVHQGPLIVGLPTNIGTVFRIKNMRSSSREDISDERIIVRSRAINAESSMTEGIHDVLIDGKENNFVKDIESLSLENFQERNNRTCPLFESNRILPSPFRQGMDNKAVSKRCYRISFPSFKSQAV